MIVDDMNWRLEANWIQSWISNKRCQNLVGVKEFDVQMFQRLAAVHIRFFNRPDLDHSSCPRVQAATSKHKY